MSNRDFSPTDARPVLPTRVVIRISWAAEFSLGQAIEKQGIDLAVDALIQGKLQQTR
jgi:hypothetical protein